MPLGYVLKTGEVLAYYGLERKDIAEAIFKFGRDRKVTVTTDPGVLGGGGGQPGFSSPDEILILAQKVMRDMEGTVPRKYPGFHGTLGRYSMNRGFLSKGQSGADLVIDIDMKGDYKGAFREGRKVLNFLDLYNAPYRVKFSGGSGPHIIIPYEAFPESLSGRRFDRSHKLLFQIITSRSRAGHVDGSFTSTNHFFRIPYSLNENTGLVSLPLRREQYDDFTPSMAEVPNVQVDEEWFQEPDEGAKEALAELLRDGSGKSKDIEDILEAIPLDAYEHEVEELQKRIEEHENRLRRLVNLEAPERVIRNEAKMLQETIRRRIEEHENRLNRLVELSAPTSVIHKEKQMLQKATQALNQIRKSSRRSEDDGDDDE